MVFCFPFLLLGHNSESITDIVKWFHENGFEPFEMMSTLPEPRIGYELKANELRANYKLLYKCLERTSEQLSAEQVSQLVELADYYMATNDGMNRIVEAFFTRIQKETNPFPNLKINAHFKEALKTYLAERAHLGIQSSYSEIKLDGWEVTSNNNQFAIRILIHLAPFYSEVTIKNLLIDDSNFAQIQSILCYHLATVRFENCSFILGNSELLNFANLTNLSNLQFSGSYCNNFIPMFKTIPIENLTHLNISNNPFDKEEIAQLIPILSGMARLETLDVSFSFPYKWNRPRFTGNILHLSNLISLNLSGNLSMWYFLDRLSKLDGTLKYEHLNLSNNGIGIFPKFNEETFLSYLPKFPALKRLVLSGMYFDRITSSPINASELMPLHELTYDAYKGIVRLTDLDHIVASKNIPIKITANGNWLRISSIFEICFHKRIELDNDSLSRVELEQSPDEFDVTELSFKHIKFINEIPQDYANFFSRFKRLKCLRISLSNLNNFEHLRMLFYNSSIEKVELHFENGFNQFDELLELLDGRIIKTFRMENNFNASSGFEKYLQGLVKVSFWKEVEAFECESISSQPAIFILQNANMPKLHTVCVNYYTDRSNCSSVRLPSVRHVSIHLQAQSDSRKKCPINSRSLSL